MSDPQGKQAQPATSGAGVWLRRGAVYAALGAAAVVAAIACGNGGSHTTASGVYYTAVATPAYYSGPGTPHVVPPGTPAVTVATPGATPTSTPSGTPTKP